MALGDFIANGLGAFSPSGMQATLPPRAAMLFTSRMRQLAVFAAGQAREGLTEATIGRAGVDALAFFGGQRAFMPTIAMAVNPNSVKFVQPKRYTKKDTRDGSVFFHFTNSKGQNNDLLTLQFAGNTGNLDLRGTLGDPNQNPSPSQQKVTNAASGTGAGADTGALYKLLVWHNLYLLTREPMVLADGTENLFSIVYSSPLFPEQVTFQGFFTRVLEFEESATKPNSRNYTFEFQVTATTPDLDEVLQNLTDILGAPPVSAEFSNPTEGAVFVNRPRPPAGDVENTEVPSS